MKTLLLIRHAKSEWGSASLADYDRPLNERGIQDAAVMAKRIRKERLVPDLILSSPALRAKSTALLMAGVWEFPIKQIRWIPELYQAGPEQFWKAIIGIPDKFRVAALYSHNPGITYFAGTLASRTLENIPTCGVFGVKADTGTWNQFPSASKEHFLFEYPKMLH